MEQLLLSFSNLQAWTNKSNFERLQSLNDAVRALKQFGYIGDYHERLLIHVGFAFDCRTFTDMGKAYAQNI